jgi:hypothetical protein
MILKRLPSRMINFLSGYWHKTPSYEATLNVLIGFMIIHLFSIILFSYYLLPEYTGTNNGAGLVPIFYFIGVFLCYLLIEDKIKSGIKLGVSFGNIVKRIVLYVASTLIIYTIMYGALSRENPPEIPTSLYGVTLGEELDIKKLDLLSEAGMLWTDLGVQDPKIGNDLARYLIVDPMRPETQTYVTVNANQEVIHIRSTVEFDFSQKERNADRLQESKHEAGFLIEQIKKKIDSVDKREGYWHDLTVLDYHKKFTIGVRQKTFMRNHLGLFKSDHTHYWVSGNKAMSIADKARDYAYYYRFDVVLQDLDAVKDYMNVMNDKKARNKILLDRQVSMKMEEKASRFVD